MVLATQVEIDESGVGDKGTPNLSRSFISNVVGCGIGEEWM